MLICSSIRKSFSKTFTKKQTAGTKNILSRIFRFKIYTVNMGPYQMRASGPITYMMWTLPLITNTSCVRSECMATGIPSSWNFLYHWYTKGYYYP